MKDVLITCLAALVVTGGLVLAVAAFLSFSILFWFAILWLLALIFPIADALPAGWSLIHLATGMGLGFALFGGVAARASVKK